MTNYTVNDGTNLELSDAIPSVFSNKGGNPLDDILRSSVREQSKDDSPKGSKTLQASPSFGSQQNQTTMPPMPNKTQLTFYSQSK